MDDLLAALQEHKLELADTLEDLWHSRAATASSAPPSPAAEGSVAGRRLAALLGLRSDLVDLLAGAQSLDLPPLPEPFESLRTAAVRHPWAAQAVLKSLAEEGVRFAETAEGAALAARLRGSEQVVALTRQFADATGRVFEAHDSPVPERWFDVLLAPREGGEDGA